MTDTAQAPTDLPADLMQVRQGILLNFVRKANLMPHL
jgi:hypothetical protein